MGLPGTSFKGDFKMYNMGMTFKRSFLILVCLFLAFSSTPAFAIGSGVMPEQLITILVIGTIIALLIGLIGFQRLLGGLMILGALVVAMVFTILFFPFSLLLAIPFGIGAIFWGYRYSTPPVYSPSYSASSSNTSNVVYAPHYSEHHHHHYPALEREVVYVPVAYERAYSLPRADHSAPHVPLPKPYDHVPLEYKDVEDRSRLLF